MSRCAHALYHSYIVLLLDPLGAIMAALPSRFEICKEDEIYHRIRNEEFPSLSAIIESKQRLHKQDASLLSKLRTYWLTAFVSRKCSIGKTRLPLEVYQLLLTEPTVHPSYVILCMSILKELNRVPNFEELPSPDDINPIVFSLWSESGFSKLKGTEKEWCPRTLKFLSEDVPHSKNVALLSVMYQYSGSQEKAEGIRELNKVFAENVGRLLSEAVITYQPPSGGLFSSGKKQPLPLKELDGTICQDFFTLLNIGQYYSEDQLLNIHSFSALKRWLLSEEFTSDSSTQVANFVVKYCIRVMEQCERKPQNQHDAALVEAVLSECLDVVSLVCKGMGYSTQSIFPVVKKLYSQFSGSARLTTSFLNFFILCGDQEMYDLSTILQNLFKVYLSDFYQDSLFISNFWEFCYQHKEYLSGPTNYLVSFFPNIFKILVWYPMNCLPEVLDFLPSLITVKSAAEVFHAIVDLPVLAAVMQLHNITTVGGPESGDYKKCIEAKDNFMFKIIFDYFMRTDSGKGDTVDMLSDFFSILEQLQDHPRVIAVAKVAPLLLKKFFEALSGIYTPEIVSSLMSGLLERVLVLYGPPFYVQEVKKIFSSSVLQLFRAHSDLVSSNSLEILDFITVFRNFESSGRNFYTNLIWCVGEHVKGGGSNSQSNDVLMKYHECLEPLAYEVALFNISEGQSEEQKISHTKLITVLMGSLAKLAAKCQELIPRVLLCLNKIIQQLSDSRYDKENFRSLLRRATELINVLKMPNVAVAVLGGASDSTGDSGNVAGQLNSTTFIVNRTSALLK